MPISAAYLDSDIAGVEANEANIGTVVDVTLPDGQSVVKGIRRGRSTQLDMELTGYSDRRSDEITVRASQFDALTVSAPVSQDTILVGVVPWTIDSAECPDSVIWIFRISQA